MTALERQQRAIDAVEYGRSLRTDLAEILVDPKRIRKPNPVAALSFARGGDSSGDVGL